MPRVARAFEVDVFFRAFGDYSLPAKFIDGLG